MEVSEFCKKHNLTEGQFYGRETVGGSLYFSRLTSIPEGFNPTVGGSLYFSRLTSIPEGFNPTVGGYLDLNGRKRYIGANADLHLIQKPELNWQDGRYISRDGIFTEVISHKSNVYRVRKIARKEIEYLITDGSGNWAHGSTLDEAKEDLLYKVTDRKKSDYEHLKLSDTLSHADAVRCYRVITGACSAGTRYFIENRLNGNRKESYAVSEIITLTAGEYGSSAFKGFFIKQIQP